MADPGIFGGSPYVRGSRVVVRRLYQMYIAGVSAERICQRYHQLKRAQIYDALSFAIDNQDLIAADIAQNEAR
jgi:uncharacterized protein (DUF433 family)